MREVSKKKDNAEYDVESLEIIYQEVKTQYESGFKAKESLQNRASSVLGFIGLMIGVYIAVSFTLLERIEWSPANQLKTQLMILSIFFVVSAIISLILSIINILFLLTTRPYYDADTSDLYEKCRPIKKRKTLEALIRGSLIDIQINKIQYHELTYLYNVSILKAIYAIVLLIIFAVPIFYVYSTQFLYWEITSIHIVTTIISWAIVTSAIILAHIYFTERRRENEYGDVKKLLNLNEEYELLNDEEKKRFEDMEVKLRKKISAKRKRKTTKIMYPK